MIPRLMSGYTGRSTVSFSPGPTLMLAQVLNYERIAREVLSHWFKHQKFTSSVRQLSMYGFHKIPHLQQGVLRSDTTPKLNTSNVPTSAAVSQIYSPSSPVRQSLPTQCRCSGEFYGPEMSTANLELVARFFEKCSDYDRMFLSVKARQPEVLQLRRRLLMSARVRSRIASLSIWERPEDLKRGIDAINAALRGTNHLYLLESAHVDWNTPIEEVIAETLRRAHAVHPVVEIEISLRSYEVETNKVIATAQDLSVAIAAYSPLGRGFLTGSIKSRNDEERARPHMCRDG
ncbi:Pyridoxal reductase [Sparassis crispa]|uniref:Pyridoxal reductase n=1 Tax=Sparassis crispa TaxID=139825 RepID=A0A401H440_9APHY|nr:Pyridoxal reductase [Sparassis crispa]GBE89182.1 Pyridoxal reductase [Sparassis crispa]